MPVLTRTGLLLLREWLSRWFFKCNAMSSGRSQALLTKWNCVKRQWQVRRRWHSSIFHRSIPWFTSEVANPQIWPVRQKLRLPEAGFFGCRLTAGGRVYFCILAYRSGAVRESRWTSWAVRPNETSGFRGRRKDLLNRASALVTTCP